MLLTYCSSPGIPQTTYLKSSSFDSYGTIFSMLLSNVVQCYALSFISNYYKKNPRENDSLCYNALQGLHTVTPVSGLSASPSLFDTELLALTLLPTYSRKKTTLPVNSQLYSLKNINGNAPVSAREKKQEQQERFTASATISSVAEGHVSYSYGALNLDDVTILATRVRIKDQRERKAKMVSFSTLCSALSYMEVGSRGETWAFLVGGLAQLAWYDTWRVRQLCPKSAQCCGHMEHKRVVYGVMTVLSQGTKQNHEKPPLIMFSSCKIKIFIII